METTKTTKQRGQEVLAAVEKITAVFTRDPDNGRAIERVYLAAIKDLDSNQVDAVNFRLDAIGLDI